MTSEERTAFIRENMLKILNDCRNYLLPEPVFRAQLNVAVVPPLTGAEFSSELKWLENENLIAGIRPELGGPVKWKITDKGRLAL
jgi:hypothetical protein